MLLAIDMSNTGIKFGLYEGSQMQARWRISTVRDKTSDEYAMLLGELLRHAGYDYAAIHAVIVSSVVPPLTPVFQALARGDCRRSPAGCRRAAVDRESLGDGH